MSQQKRRFMSENDWMHKYLVIAGHARPKTHEEPVPASAPPVNPSAAVEDDRPTAATVAPAPKVEEPAKKPARKRAIKKELNDAAEKPKRKPAAKKVTAKKPFPRRKPTSHKPE